MTIGSLILADDHHLVRQSLRRLLEDELDCQVVAEAADGLEVVKLVVVHRPNILIVDMVMPGLNGLEVTRQVVSRSPTTRVMLLSMHSNEPYVLEALRAGAQAYVLKEAPAAEFVHAVREVAAGRRYLSPRLAERALRRYTDKREEVELDPYETLTPREREVLHLAAQGLSNPEIAGRLLIGVRSVESHRAAVLKKLELRNQTDLIRYAIRRGVIPLED